MTQAAAALKTSRMLLLLCLITVVVHLGVIGNPGFYSHDEWEKFDHVERFGLANFASAYGRVIAGPEFGFPVRPLGFIQQAFSSQWMQAAPFVPHTIDVALHFALAAVVLLALVDIGGRRSWALVAAVAFTVSPLTTMATGWVGASFDQWYTLFVVLAGWIAFKAARDGMTLLRALALLASATCAILSKETALILPGAVVLAMAGAFLCKPPGQRFHFGAAAMVVVLVTLPLAVYLGLRWPALQNTLAGKSHSAYTPSLGSLRHNLVAYFAFPFLPQAGEFSSLAPYSRTVVAFALALHGLLVVGVWFYAGRLWTALYLLAYVMFVTPVLPLATPAGHYIYGSSIPMALAIAAVLHGAWMRRQKLVVGAMAVGVVLLVSNTLQIERWMYRDGRCQSAFLASLDRQIAALPQREGLTLLVVPSPEARGWVAQRAAFSRWRYSGEAGMPRVTFDPTTPDPKLRLGMDAACTVSRLAD